jgi:hypothetical protein
MGAGDRDIAPSIALRPAEDGDLDWIVRRHGELYALERGWDEAFEALCARVVAEYREIGNPAGPVAGRLGCPR